MNFSLPCSKKYEPYCPPLISLAVIVLGCWLAVVMVSGWVRPIFPSNELRYISVAWEMWVHHSFIVPLQGTEPYPHKPPLLFWLVHIGWSLFGVNSWWPRLIPELFGLATLVMVYLTARILWPQQTQIAQLAPLLLMGMLGWQSQLGLFKFDVILSFFVICSLYGLLRALNQQGRWLWWLLAIWIALAILTKGPVCLLFICPPMILLSVWFKDKTKSHYYKMLGSFCLALLFALLWAGPAAWLGGKRYADAIFWHQSAGRIAGEFGGIKHWYAYLEFLLWLLFPWSLWWVLWRGLWRFFKESLNQENSSLRFLAAVIIPALVCLTIIPVKSERYIIPLLPWFALFFSYILVRYSVNLRGYDQILISLIYIALGISYLILPHISSPLFQHRFYWMAELSPIWGYIQIALGILIAFLSYAGNRVLILNLTLMSTAVFVIFNLGWVKIEAKHNDLRPMALQIAELERHQAPIALYQSDFEFEFFGRLRHPSTLISSRHALNKWIQAHPNGWVVSVNPHVYPKQFILKPASDYSLNGNKSNF